MGAVAFISYTLFYLGLVYFYGNIKGRIRTLESPPRSSSIGMLLWIGFALRIVIAPLGLSFPNDMGLFRYWAQEGAKDLIHIYSNASFLDYPPFYIYVLSIIGTIARILGLSGDESLYVLLLKLPSILADLATAYLLYKLAVKRLPGSWPLAVAGLYIFNPAVVLDTAIWGQVDSFLMMLLAAGFYLLDADRPELCAFPFAAAVLTKPQGLILMPVVLFELIKRKDIKLLLKTAAYGVGAIVLLAMPFAIVEGPMWLLDLYLSTTGNYTYASLNAFNFFAMLGANLKQDSETFVLLSYKVWGYAFIVLTVLYTAIIYIRGRGRHLAYLGGLLLSLGVFVLSVRMHERYMFPAMFFLLALFVMTRDKRALALYGVASFTSFTNVYAVLEKMLRVGDGHLYMNDIAIRIIVHVFSVINVILLIYAVAWAWRIAVPERINKAHLIPEKGKAGRDEDHRPESADHKAGLNSAGVSSARPRVRAGRTDVIIMAVMTAVYLVIAFINLGGFEVPQTEWMAEKVTEGFIIELPRETYVKRLSYYCGLGDKGDYNVWVMDSKGQYELLDEKIKDDEFYKWRALDISRNVTSIRVQARDIKGSLLEIALFGEDTKKPLEITLKHLDGTPVTEDDPLYNLIDEQDIAKYTHTYMTGTYFDEIYHARTAYEHLHKIRPYEWTHPPLGKLFIAIGIKIFGMNTFGWRIVGTLFGAAMIPIMYMFGLKLFRKSFYGFCAAFLMMFDLMHFAQTRIATIDSYTTFFVILMYYFMMDYYLNKSYTRGFARSLVPLFLSGLFFGLGAAVKWSAIYAAPGLAVIFFLAKYEEFKDYRQHKKLDEAERPSWVKRFIPAYWYGTLLSCVVFFIIIPAAIYFLSYIPYLQVEGMTFKDILEYQKRMYNYHSGLEATHSFQSPWWSWPLIIRPIWYYKAPDMPAGLASTISSFGNPAVWWAGLAAFFYALKEAVVRNKKALLLVIAIVSQILPWTLISRAAFIYHFFPIIPFMMLAVVYVINKLEDMGLERKWVYAYLALVLVLFIVFYPAVSGMVIPRAYAELMEILPSWVFWT
ncbi:MAG TPA: glycosyltransferase family 39 protein [Candidatus Atribacteria bacterium]|nr:glycosyltransferase family 39 protein [Candidatus Atribacteria bacterium]HPT79179.1 glycosyltransferase family 39 protein [Candidatus Atribacteria bacterium]